MPLWTMDPPQQFFTGRLGVLSADDILAVSATEYHYWGLGGKAKGLVKLVDQGFPVPPFFVVSSRVFWSQIPAAKALRWQSKPLTPEDIEQVKHAIDAFNWGYVRKETIHRYLSDICPDGRPVAVRSSAAHEDSAQQSYAGQFDSKMYVAHDRVCQAIQDVWRSALSEELQGYTHAQGGPFTLQIPSVVVQRNVHATQSGVAFSADPITGQRGLCVVSAVYGLGTALVSGEVDAVTWHIASATSLPPFEPEAILSCLQPTSPQTSMHTWINTDHCEGDNEGVEGIRVVPCALSSDNAKPLTDELAKTVAALAWDCESANNGVPQDVEWAIEDDKLWVLQSRPITADVCRDPELRVDYTAWPLQSQWVRDTAQETWPDPVKPATIAFARRWVAATHRVLGHMACVPKVPLSQLEWMFPELIGSVGSRLYQHQSLMDEFWRQAPSLTFTFKRCQAILGRWFPSLQFAAESPYHVLYTGQGGFHSMGLLVKTAAQWGLKILNLLWAIGRLPKRQYQFVHAMAALQAEYETVPLVTFDEGVKRLNRLDALWFQWADVSALTNYWATCLSDFLDARYPVGPNVTPWRDISGKNTTEPMGQSVWNNKSYPEHRFYQQWQAAKNNALAQLPKHVVQILLDESVTDEACWEMILKDAQSVFDHYNQQFGLRCAGEVVIEAPVLADNPVEWVQLLRSQLRVGQHTTLLPRQCHIPALWQPLVNDTHRWLNIREYVRYGMSRWAHGYRLTINALGQLLVNEGIFSEAEQVHYLLYEELEALIVGSLPAKVALQRIESRKARYTVDTQSSSAVLPPRVVISFGRYVNSATSPKALIQSLEGLQSRAELTGQCVCGGTITAPVLVWTARELPSAEQCHGKILVVPQGSPALVARFAHVAGLVFEVGSALSHPAIVARELNIPTLVGVAHATQWLDDGDMVTLDATAGVIKKSPS